MKIATQLALSTLLKSCISVTILGIVLMAQVDFYTNNRALLPSSNGYSNAGKINKTVKFLADQLSQNKDFANISNSKLAITSFVNIENLRETSKLGNLISEHLIHDMQIRGYRVVDYKTMPDIEIGQKGDFVFSRAVDSLKKDITLNYILSGTYTFYIDGVSINARIIDIQTNVVVSTAQAFIPKYDLKYLLDSMSPYDSLNPGSANVMVDTSDNDNLGGYIVPGVEGTRVKIKKADW